MVGRRGRSGDGSVAVWLRRRRAVLMRPRNGVVGGRSVLKERLVVHHLTRRTVSLSRLFVSCSLSEQSRSNKNNFDYLAFVNQNAVRCWLRLRRGKHKDNALRKNETSSLSMRQLCLKRRNNPKSSPNVLRYNGNDPSCYGNG